MDAANYRPVNLTSTFRKIIEYCLQKTLYDQTSFIDTAQGGFKPFLNSVDQAACLDELMHRFKTTHGEAPVVVFLDITKAYDQCSRSTIWNKMAQETCNVKLLNILKILFDDVYIQVINGNYESNFFQPVTGVLQGSVLSPHCIPSSSTLLPQLLRQTSSNNPSIQDINWLLFADDVALISDLTSMHHLLKLCEEHSLLTGYRWSPTKCAVLSPKQDPPNPLLSNYQLFGTTLPTTTTFKYLGLQFNYLGMDTQAFINTTKEKVSKSMHRINHIGARANGFSLPLSVRIYTQFI